MPCVRMAAVLAARIRRQVAPPTVRVACRIVGPPRRDRRPEGAYGLSPKTSHNSKTVSH